MNRLKRKYIGEALKQREGEKGDRQKKDRDRVKLKEKLNEREK